MTYIYIILFVALIDAFARYLDKHLVNMGISRKDYFYYMCLSMIPFSLLMILIEYLNHQLRFSFKIVPFLLLAFAMIIRYKIQHTVVGCLKYLNPYEDASYLTLGIIIAFVIDTVLGIEKFNFIALISIFLTIFGVFLISNSKLKIKNLRKDLIIRISMSLIMSYITHYLLQYWSNAVYLLLLNLILTIIFSKGYTFQYNKKNKNILKWVFAQQTFGFLSLYLSNYLVTHSVTLSSYVNPTSIVIVVIFSFFYKEQSKKPTLKQIFAVILITFSILLINY